MLWLYNMKFDVRLQHFLADIDEELNPLSAGHSLEGDSLAPHKDQQYQS